MKKCDELKQSDDQKLVARRFDTLETLTNPSEMHCGLVTLRLLRFSQKSCSNLDIGSIDL